MRDWMNGPLDNVSTKRNGMHFSFKFLLKKRFIQWEVQKSTPERDFDKYFNINYMKVTSYK